MPATCRETTLPPRYAATPATHADPWPPSGSASDKPDITTGRRSPAPTRPIPHPEVPECPKPTQPPAATIEQGTWAVPDEVKPGTYVSDGGDGCYWARLRDLTGGINSIIANGGDVGRQRVTILRSDKGFETNECGVWRKVG
jgi:hypothetical protein